MTCEKCKFGQTVYLFEEYVHIRACELHGKDEPLPAPVQFTDDEVECNDYHRALLSERLAAAVRNRNRRGW